MVAGYIHTSPDIVAALRRDLVGTADHEISAL